MRPLFHAILSILLLGPTLLPGAGPGAAEGEGVVPIPQAGDRARYDVIVEGPGVSGAWTYDLAWDPVGRPVVDAVLHLGADAKIGMPRGIRMAFGEGLVPRQTTLEVLHAPVGIRLPDSDLFLVRANLTVDKDLFHAPLGPLSCLARGGWQGERPDRLDGRAYEALCPHPAPRPAQWGPTPYEGFSLWTESGAVATVAPGPHVGTWTLEAEARDDRGGVRHQWTLMEGLSHPLTFVEETWGGYRAIRTTFSLVGFTPGRGAVAWWEAPDPAPAASLRAPPGDPFHLEGVGGATAFPLTEALAHAMGDPALVGFHGWRAEYPGALLGAAFYEEPCGVDRHRISLVPLESRWRLTWQSPEGQARVVEVARQGVGPAGSALVTAVDLGASARPPFAPGDMPADVATVSALVEAWRHAAGVDRRPSLLGFDLGLGKETGRAVVGVACTRAGLDGGGYREEREYRVAEFHYPSGRLDRVVSWSHGVDAPLAPPGLLAAVHPASAAPTPPRPEGWGIALAGAPLVGAGFALWALLRRAARGGLPLWPMPLYTRRRPERLLDHPLRRQIYEFVAAQPGAFTAEIWQATGIQKTVLSYHLRALQEGKILTPLRRPRHVHWFLAGRYHSQEMERLVATRRGAPRLVLQCIREDPGITRPRLVEKLGLSAGTVWKSVHLLESLGLLAARREEKATRLYPVQP